MFFHDLIIMWFSASGGAENAGFINCCAPQTFLHGFVIK
jgi:hypothetical protein